MYRLDSGGYLWSRDDKIVFRDVTFLEDSVCLTKQGIIYRLTYGGPTSIKFQTPVSAICHGYLTMFIKDIDSGLHVYNNIDGKITQPIKGLLVNRLFSIGFDSVCMTGCL
jgi:hypothetical protein